uniref:Uncharacterized protein n=1 Tax=Sus scrofa TaxID=9823 RepID=A0A4X1UAX3_PIG
MLSIFSCVCWPSVYLLWRNVYSEFACEAIWSWTFVGSFLITVSISVLVIGPFIFSISSWFSLGRLYFSKNLSISSRFSVLLAYSCI